MFRGLLIFVALAVAVFSHDSLREEEIFIPSAIVDHLGSITDDQFEVLRELANVAKERRTIPTRSEFLAKLKDKSPSMHKKALQFQSTFKAKVDALGEEARAFVNWILAGARRLFNDILNGNMSYEKGVQKYKSIVAAYEKLSDEAKGQLKLQFPSFSISYYKERYSGSKHKWSTFEGPDLLYLVVLLT